MPSTDSNNFFTEDSQLSPRTQDPWAFRIALCLLPLVLFFSFWFSVFSPAPILYLYAGDPNRKQGLLWAILASIFGLLLCFAVKGLSISILFLLVTVVPGLALGEFFVRKIDPSIAIITTALLTFALTGSAILVGAKQKNLAPTMAVMQTLKSTIEETKAWSAKNGGEEPENLGEVVTFLSDPQNIKRNIPGALLTLSIIISSLSAVILIRWNPKSLTRRANIRRDYIRRWKTPDWFVWIALFCLVFYFFETRYLTTIATNLTNPILLIYFFQGMSILAFFLDALRIRGPLRALIYGTGIFFLTPMIVSFGFFDLWLNLRSRKQTEEEDKS